MQGIFKPKNPSKYQGNPTNIIYRSSWELMFMRWCDTSASIIKWGSEELVIPYVSPIDNRYHRYFMDFQLLVKEATGKNVVVLVEIKPKAQCMPPMLKEGKKPSKSYLNQVMTWEVNQAKWKAATELCRKKGWQFKIVTEDHLGIK